MINNKFFWNKKEIKNTIINYLEAENFDVSEYENEEIEIIEDETKEGLQHPESYIVVKLGNYQETWNENLTSYIEK